MKKLILIFMMITLVGCNKNYAPEIKYAKDELTVYVTYELGVNFTDHMLALISSSPEYNAYKVKHDEVLEKTNDQNLDMYYELMYTHKISYIFPQLFYYIPNSNNFDTSEKWDSYFDDWIMAINHKDISYIEGYIANSDVKPYIRDVFNNTDDETWHTKYVYTLDMIEDIKQLFNHSFKIYENDIWPSLSFELHKKSENINAVLKGFDIVSEWKNFSVYSYLDEPMVFSLTNIDNPDFDYLSVKDNKVVMYYDEVQEVTEFVELISHRVGYKMLQDNFSDLIIESYNKYEYMQEKFNLYEIIDNVSHKLLSHYNTKIFKDETVDYKLYVNDSKESMNSIISEEVYLNGVLIKGAMKVSLDRVLENIAHDNVFFINDVLNYHGFEFNKLEISKHLNDRTVYYHDHDSMMIEKDGNYKVIAEYYNNMPRLSEAGDQLLYIYPDQWEAIGDVYVYDLESMTSKMIFEAPKASNFKVKKVEWYNHNTIYLIQGYAYGTVSKGGLLYEYNIRKQVLELIDIPLQENQEIVDVKINNNNMTLTIITFDENYNNFTENNMKIEIVD